MDIIMNSMANFSSLSSTFIIGMTAAIGFVNYYFIFAVKVIIIYS